MSFIPVSTSWILAGERHCAQIVGERASLGCRPRGGDREAWKRG